jgi:hypothetical protein
MELLFTKTNFGCSIENWPCPAARPLTAFSRTILVLFKAVSTGSQGGAGSIQSHWQQLSKNIPGPFNYIGSTFWSETYFWAQSAAPLKGNIRPIQISWQQLPNKSQTHSKLSAAAYKQPCDWQWNKDLTLINRQQTHLSSPISSKEGEMCEVDVWFHQCNTLHFYHLFELCFEAMKIDICSSNQSWANSIWPPDAYKWILNPLKAIGDSLWPIPIHQQCFSDEMQGPFRAIGKSFQEL